VDLPQVQAHRGSLKRLLPEGLRGEVCADQEERPSVGEPESAPQVPVDCGTDIQRGATLDGLQENARRIEAGLWTTRPAEGQGAAVGRERAKTHRRIER